MIILDEKDNIDKVLATFDDIKSALNYRDSLKDPKYKNIAIQMVVK